MISAKNIKKQFIRTLKNNKTETFYADDDISFEAKAGTIVGILGPNGAGKTTLLRILAGILNPTSGTVSYDNLMFPLDEIEIKKSIAYLSGNTKLYNTISTYELLMMCGSIYGVSENDTKKRIKELSKKLDLESFMYNKIESLSTGQTQRVNIARCLLHNPKYYILDEATSGLDIISSQIILNFIKQEKKDGKTIIYSTHYMEEAENICDYVLLINKGKVVKEGTPKKIISETKTTNLRDAFFEVIAGDNDEK